VTRLLSGEQEYDVALRSSGSGLEVVVDGRLFHPDVTEVAPGTYLLRFETRVETFHCVRQGDAIHLFWRGAAYRLEELSEDAPSVHRHSSGALEAPMPGKVIAIRVEVGQKVEKGEEVLVVEAMKMENAVRAPRTGTVKAVAVKVGDRVSPGAVLAELE